MAEFTVDDLAVVIPTRDRWDILDRTLASLSSQSVSGFESIVVVDGTDQDPPRVDAERVLLERRAGPAAARNAGARATERPLVMFIGDDTIPAPDFVERHLAAHGRHPEREAAAVGFVDWHPEVSRNRINRWLDWSGTQFWYSSLADEGEQEVSHWFFYTSNLSLKREFLLDAGGFDEEFPFAAFEDLDCGLRLSCLGLRLYYEPGAVCHHLHGYDWPALERRFASMALSERLMVDKHPEVTAGALGRMKAAQVGRALPLDRFVDIVPRRLKRLERFVRAQADRHYHRRLAPGYLRAWERAGELCELRRYLDSRYDSARLVYSSGPDVAASGGTQPGNEWRDDEEGLFDGARQALAGKNDYAVSVLLHHLRPGSRILVYGCGIGTEGLRLAQGGHRVDFADQHGSALTYLRWRLADRRLTNGVWDLATDELPGDFDAAVCLDAEGRGRDALGLLERLERVARTVALGISPGATRTSSNVPTHISTGVSGTRTSRLVARHELPGGSVMAVYERHKAGSTALGGPATEEYQQTEPRARR